MGIYLNPGNNGFKEILNGEYVDKTGLISLMNSRIDTPAKLVCVSRPRRFGKSFAASMLSAYYDCGCNSGSLFEGLSISSDPGFVRHLNRYNVISLDIAGIISETVQNKASLSDVPKIISERVRKELTASQPGIAGEDSVISCFIEYVRVTGKKFIFIIDEWDAIIREARDDVETQRIYLNMLRSWFKNNSFTPRVVAAAYMTGILPIKKDSSQSAISNFNEFTILDPGPFTEYTGFTEIEVRELCGRHGMDFGQFKDWYDGYEFVGTGAVYNPSSVMEALQTGKFESYWRKSSVAESLIPYINMDMDGLQADIVKLIAGEPIKVNIRTFKNDFENFGSKDDVVTLLIHLGYLTYDCKSGNTGIPNKEVRIEFTDILKNPKRSKLAKLIQDSEKLLEDTLAGNEDAVAKAIERIRETNYAPQYYNNEQALRYTIKFAYIVCVDRFLRVEELPSGRGIADVVYIPDRNTAYPPIIIELKWNRDPGEALDQADEKKYAAVLSGYAGDVVLVGISYDENSKVHSCRIRKEKLL